MLISATSHYKKTNDIQATDEQDPSEVIYNEKNTIVTSANLSNFSEVSTIFSLIYEVRHAGQRPSVPSFSAISIM